MSANTARYFSSRAGIWPDGEPQPVRDAADRVRGPRAYDVHMVVIGGHSAYEVVAIYEDRRTAGEVARAYNEAHFRPGDINRRAWVEESSFHPAEAPV